MAGNFTYVGGKMPQPVLYGPTVAEVYRKPGGKNPSKSKRSLVEAAAGGDAVGASRLEAAKRRVREIERRAAKNKRGMSPRARKELEDANSFIKMMETAQERAARDLRRRDASNKRKSASDAAKRAAKRAGNPPKKAANKSAAPKKAAKRTARAPRKAQ